MPRLFHCLEYVQTSERGASLSLRNSCLKCGRTREAHILNIIPPEEQATNWLNNKGLGRASYFELVRNILTQYIKDQQE